MSNPIDESKIDGETVFDNKSNISWFGSIDDEQHVHLPQLGLANIILQLLQLYYTPTLVILGCIGNILSVVVFFGTKLKKHSSSYYLAALAISDSGFLIAQFITWLNMVNVPLFQKSGFCQMAIYCSHICSFLSVWLVVLFTIERFIAVRYPLHRASVCTVARAKLFITCLTIIAIPIYAPYFVIAAPRVMDDIVINNKNITICAVVPKWMGLATTLNHVDFFVTLVLPFCTIIVLNTQICRTVHSFANVRTGMTFFTRKRFQSQNSNKGSSRKSFQRYINRRNAPQRATTSSQTKVTQMLLVVSTVFICLNLPSYLLRIWIYVNQRSNAFDDELMGLLQHYSNILFATNFGINFILYCISGQNFRKSLRTLCGAQHARGRHEYTQATGESLRHVKGVQDKKPVERSNRQLVILDEQTVACEVMTDIHKNPRKASSV